MQSHSIAIDPDRDLVDKDASVTHTLLGGAASAGGWCDIQGGCCSMQCLDSQDLGYIHMPNSCPCTHSAASAEPTLLSILF